MPTLDEPDHGVTNPPQKRLWEIDHPYYGAEGRSNHFDTFAELRTAVDRCDEDMNSCDVTHADEPAVLEWLHSERVAGHLRKTWEPILDATPPDMDLTYLRGDLDYWRGRAEAAEAMVASLEKRLSGRPGDTA